MSRERAAAHAGLAATHTSTRGSSHSHTSTSTSSRLAATHSKARGSSKSGCGELQAQLTRPPVFLMPVSQNDEVGYPVSVYEREESARYDTECSAVLIWTFSTHHQHRVQQAGHSRGCGLKGARYLSSCTSIPQIITPHPTSRPASS